MAETRKEKISKAMQALEDKHGRLTAELVVRAARNPRSVLHDEFEWDDKKAGHAFRLKQAGELIRVVTIVTTDGGRVFEPGPYYVRDQQKPNNKQGMIAITSDLIDRNHAIKIMDDELSRCENSIERARAVVGILDKRHTGLSRRLEELLAQVIEARRLFLAA